MKINGFLRKSIAKFMGFITAIIENAKVSSGKVLKTKGFLKESFKKIKVSLRKPFDNEITPEEKL